MPPALQNPIDPLAAAHRRPRRARLRLHAPGAALEGDRLRRLPARLRGRHLAALRAGRRARQDQARPRPARRDPPRAAGGGRRRAQRHRGRRGARPRATRRRRKGIQVGAVQRVSPEVLLRRGHRARAGQGHARPAARLLPRQLGGARRGRGRVRGRDDRPLRAPGEGADRPGGDPHPRAARERARRRRAGDRRARAAAATRSWCSCPGVTDVEQAKRVIKTTAQLSLKLVENSAATQETLLQGVGGKVPDNMEMVSGPGDTAGRAGLLPAAPGGAHHRPRPQERPRRGRREQPAADQLRAERHRDRQVRARDRAQHRPPARDRARRHRLLGPRHPEQARRRQPHHRPLHDRRRRTSSPRS